MKMVESLLGNSRPTNFYLISSTDLSISENRATHIMAESRTCNGSIEGLRAYSRLGRFALGYITVPGYSHTLHILVSTAIGLRKYRIPSDLRSQAEYRLVSTMVGDHMGILGVVVFDFLHAYGQDR